MSAVTPNSDLFLLKCPLEMDNQHQMNFASKTAQYNYFHGLPKKLQIDDDDYSYIRQDSVLRIGAHIDTLLEYNYVMYRNENYSNKWFYAFITDMEYLNDNCTAVTIKTDVFQTWQFDLTFRKCFVEREHVNDDTTGKHTVPENLELGEYVCCSHTNWTYGTQADNLMVAFQVTKRDLGNGNVAPSNTLGVFGGIPQGCTIFGVPYNQDALGMIAGVTGLYDAAGAGDAIVSIFLSPTTVNGWTQKSGTGFFDINKFYVPDEGFYAWGDVTPLNVISEGDFQGYTVKNNKLRTAPYRYFHISNNLGSDVSFAYEEFNGTPQFNKSGAFSPSTSVRLSPLNSLKSTTGTQQISFDEGIEGGVLPQISWASDYYLNWQAVNAKNVEVQTALSGVSFGLGTIADLIGGAALGAAPSGEGIIGLSGNLANTLQQVKEAKMTPPQAKGSANAGDMAFSMGRYRYDIYCMSIKREYAEIIDNYFSQVGYKVNSVKVPNITGRRNWNYVKCIDVNILADIPQADLNEIKGFFNRGITIWHNPNTFLDYTQNNDIV